MADSHRLNVRQSLRQAGTSELGTLELSTGIGSICTGNERSEGVAIPRNALSGLRASQPPQVRSPLSHYDAEPV